MMCTIWKFPLDLMQLDPPFCVLGMPIGARILTLQLQEDVPCLWMEVDPNAEMEKRRFVVVGTGHLIPDNSHYIGTWQSPPFVWHLYEVERVSQ